MTTETAGEMKLLTPTLIPLPLGSIRPAGWLRDQLRIQADGLSGHLDEFWPDVRDSGWIGGDAEGWERGPYWLDGIVPLAFLLNDTKLLAKARRWMDYILAHQQPDGWLGPCNAKRSGNWYGEPYDPWPVFIFLKALTQYAEATEDRRAIPAIAAFLRRLAGRLDQTPLSAWARYRWQDLVLSIAWLHDRLPQPWLIRLAEKVRSQGIDWRSHFANFSYREKTAEHACTMDTHAPNNAMGLKAPGVWFRFSGDPEDRAAVFHMLDMLDRYHGQATGMFSGDEHYAGRNPSQGIELCAVVELMYSLEVLCSILGDVRLADRLERIAFNALPAAFSPDMWAHQYDQQPNQAVCRVPEDRIYTNNGPASNLFGLEPHFGCCTANMHQGWPKFATHLWMRVPGNDPGPPGLAAVAYAPCEVAIDLNGTPIQLEVETDYPFAEAVHVTVRPAMPVRFPLMLCIPEWAEGATVSLETGETQLCAPGGYHILDRDWKRDTRLVLNLPFRVRIERRYNNAAAIHRGPLLYSLKIAEDWRQIGGELPHADWEVHPVGNWNYALEIDPADPERSLTFQTRPVGARPFSPAGAPVRATVTGRLLPEWTLEHNAAAPPPPSPVHSSEPCERITLIPYGCTNLRITEFPTLA